MRSKRNEHNVLFLRRSITIREETERMRRRANLGGRIQALAAIIFSIVIVCASLQWIMSNLP